MKKIKINIVWLIIGFVLSFYDISAQSLTLLRTDVDSLKSKFVTATFIFGVDILLEKVDNPRGVVFELHYTDPQLIEYSDSKVMGFGKTTTALVIPKINPDDSTDGILHIGVLRELDDTSEINQPKIIHVEFAVSPSAIHGNNLSISFDKAEAIVSTPKGGATLKLTTKPVSYLIHSFIDVWPGDANNDGVVDITDVAAIGVHLGYNIYNKTYRSFKREDNSTFWINQKALAWDSVEVTYADCDGNGDVNVTDMLVVGHNFLKTRPIINKNPQNPITKINLNDDAVRIDGLVRKAINIETQDALSGISGTVSLADIPHGLKFAGFQKAECFDENSFIFWKENLSAKSVDFAVSSLTIPDAVKNNQTVCYVLFESDGTDIPQLRLTGLTGMTQNGILIPVNEYVLNISEQKNDNINQYNIMINNINHAFSISEKETVQNIRIVNLCGNIMANIDNDSYLSAHKTSIDKLPEGFYILIVQTTSGTKIHKLIIY